MTHQISTIGNHRLPPAELTVLRARLHEDRRLRRQRLRGINQFANSAAGTASAPDVAAPSEVHHKLPVAARTALADTETALARMDAGRYGGCGRSISLQCLSVHPQARYCTRCQHFLGTQE